MRRLVISAIGAIVLHAASIAPAAASCTREEFAKAVDTAGAALRKINADNAPRLRTKMRQLKDKNGWPDTGYEEKAYEALADERIVAFDAQANELLAKVDTLGTVDSAGPPDCARLYELAAASLELQATVKAKTAYMLSKLDQMLGEPIAPEPKVKTAEARPPVQRPAAAATEPTSEESKSKAAEVKAAPPPPPSTAAKPAEPGRWSTQTTGQASREVAIAQPPPQGLPPPPPGGGVIMPEEEGYTIEEIKAASAGFFGKVSSGLGSVIEHLFRNSGRPTGYVLGTEGGGAFIAGVRYGSGVLYMRSGGTHKIYWHGPSLGTDVGAAGSQTLFLIYKLQAPEQLYANFTGLDGSAYFVGGVGVTLVTNGAVVMAPIRSGVGLRLGASIGYIRFTPRATWNPF